MDYQTPASARHIKLHYLPILVDGACDGFFAIGLEVTASRRETSTINALGISPTRRM